jgi:uncharacterized membrane protein
VDAAPRSSSARAGRWLSILTELLLVAVGIPFLTSELSDLPLALWCVIGTAYMLVTVLVLTVSAIRPPLAAAPDVRRAGPRIEYLVSILSTLLASLVGAWAAVQVVLLRSSDGSAAAGQPTVSGFELLALWAMLLSWGLLHWGFAQGYRYLYYARTERPLSFPRTDMPKMVDFAYFAFGLGTSFAVSDVETLGSGIRWVALWHSVISFFFNGLIIVFALNIIMSAGH